MPAASVEDSALVEELEALSPMCSVDPLDWAEELMLEAAAATLSTTEVAPVATVTLAEDPEEERFVPVAAAIGEEMVLASP